MRMYDFQLSDGEFREKITEIFELSAEKIDTLTLEASTFAFEIMHLAARSIVVTDTDSGELRALIVDRANDILTRLADFPVPEHIRAAAAGKNVFIPSVESYRHWSNAEIMKDKCITGYALSRETGGRCVFYFGHEDKEHPYLQNLPGLEMPLVPQTDKTVFGSYLKEHAAEMDINIFNGAYPTSEDYAGEIKLQNPKAVNIVSYDMNNDWFSLLEKEPEWVDGLKHFDVTVNSGRGSAEVMNKSPAVKSPVFWIPNAFTGTALPVDMNKKQNIILTVGRIGIEDKYNERMLEEFAVVAGEMPDYTLRLVGNVEERFKPFLDEFFKIHPELTNRIIFTGLIQNKKDLYDEYANAKIFLLTSLKEGGCPNVFGEALAHGCFMVVSSQIDSAAELTDHGRIGIIYDHKIKGTTAFALKMAAACTENPFFKEPHKARCDRLIKRIYSKERIAAKLLYLLKFA